MDEARSETRAGERRGDGFALVLVLAATAVVCAFRAGNEFIWDDIPMFVEGDLVFHPEVAPALFVHDAMYISNAGASESSHSLDTYRPLTLLTFVLDGMWGGRRPLPFHVTGALLHLGVVSLLFFVARGLMRTTTRRYAWVPALFVGVHPLLVEAHAWINGRSDTLCTLFVLLTLWVWYVPAQPADHARLGSWRAFAASATFLCALLSKEVALFCVPALCVLHAWGHRGAARRTVREVLAHAAPLLVAVMAYFALRANALGGVKATGGSPHLWIGVQRVAFHLWFGLRELLVPARTATHYLMEDYAGVAPAMLLLAWLALLAAGVLVVRLMPREPLLASALIGFAGVLSPAVLISGLRWYGLGRYLYLPSTLLAIGATDAVAALLHARPPRAPLRRPLLAAGVLYLGLLGALAARATRDLHDQVAFYAAIIRDFPERSHGYGGAGRVLVERGAFEPAIALLQRAVAIAPGDHRYWNNLAQAHLRAGDLPGAAATAREGLRHAPGQPKLHHVLAAALASTDPEGAARNALEALRLDPQRDVTWALVRELVTRHPRHDEIAAALRAQSSAPPFAGVRPKLLTLLQLR